MATRRNAPKRPARPRAGKASGGPRVSGSVTVSPRFTLFGGGLISFNLAVAAGAGAAAAAGAVCSRA